MNIRPIVVLAGIILLQACSTQDGPTIRHLAFGSCIQQNKPAPIFDVINKERPDVFVFVGDNIYGDTNDMEVLKKKYEQMTSRPGYQILDSQSRILATWDDHDFGRNDAGREYPHKAESQQIFLDTFKEPAGTRRRRTEGIFTSYMFGPAEERVQVILLDNRYFRSKLKTGEKKEKGGSYAPNNDPAATMLGDAQWAWLRGELMRPARLRLVLGGTQILREHNGYEAWANLPLEQEKLVNLIRQTRAEGLIFLTGDTHWAELTKRDFAGCYPLYDLTSSGLTEVWSYMSPNKFRFEEMAFRGANFGSVLIDWQADDPAVTLQVTNPEGKVPFRHTVRLSELRFPAP